MKSFGAELSKFFVSLVQRLFNNRSSFRNDIKLAKTSSGPISPIPYAEDRPDPIEWADIDQPASRRTYEECLQILKRRLPCAIFIGAGPSASDYPSWSDLVQKVKVNMRIPASSSSEEDYLQSLKHCREINSSLFYNTLREIFNPDQRHNYHSVHQYISDTPYSAFLTTNIDSFMMNRFRDLTSNGSRRQIFYYPDQLRVTDLRDSLCASPQCFYRVAWCSNQSSSVKS